MRLFAVSGIAIALFGCKNAESTPDGSVANSEMGANPNDDGGGDSSEMGGAMIDVAGAYATLFHFNLSLAQNGATTTSSIDVPILRLGIENPRPDGTATVSSQWSVCDLPVPTGLDLNYFDVFQSIHVTTTNGALSSPNNGATYSEGPVTFVAGACLAQPGSDPLPTGATAACPPGKAYHPCSAGVMGCSVVTTDKAGHVWHGVPAKATGLIPDADTVYLDLRLTTSFTATAKTDLTANGSVTNAAIEYHVLDCHLRNSGPCAQTDIDALEKSRPTITVTNGSVRAHAQGTYYNCSRFALDPIGGVSGSEPPPGAVDAGTIDSGALMTFAVVQRGMDEMGCGTQGCHGSFSAPSQMHLILRPTTEAELQQNYQAVLPWTKSSNTATPTAGLGGRFVNEVPLSTSMKQQWLDWISAGMPY